MIELTDAQALSLGNKIVDLMGIKSIKGTLGADKRFSTSMGDKTAGGVARCVLRVLKEAGYDVSKIVPPVEPEEETRI